MFNWKIEKKKDIGMMCNIPTKNFFFCSAKRYFWFISSAGADSLMGANITVTCM